MIDPNCYNSTLNKKRSLMNHQQIESLNIKSTTTRKLPKFILSTPQQKFEYDANSKEISHQQQHNANNSVTNAGNLTDMCLNYYSNTPAMLAKLVYLKNKLSTEGKICLDNVVNLNMQLHSKKQTSLESTYQLQGDKDRTLIFESRFENGNLLAAFKSEDNKYQLILQKDTNSTGYNQWFFFRVGNTKKKNKVVIDIINCLSKNSQYSKGIKVWTYSEKKSKCEGIGWYHPNQNTNYSTNGFYCYIKDKKKYYSTLSFDYTFEYDDDFVYFANCIPYTYSDLMKDLAEYQKGEITKYPFYHRKTLCTTLAGNDLDYITINNSKIEGNTSINIVRDKEAVILIARQHPSETPGSWIIKGAIEFLLSKSEEACFLRDNFIFKIIPMMNPDGVIEGNSRTSFAGCDLNRYWSNPKELFHPEIYYTKELIGKLSLQRKINCLVDFQGHIGEFNSFFKCNSSPEEESAFRTFPLITSIESEKINFPQCTFHMENLKNQSCRISLYNELHINNIVTLVTSNFGFTVGKHSNCYYDVNILKEIGRDVCIGILMHHYYSLNKMNKTIEFCLSEPLEKRIQNVLKELDILMKKDKENEDTSKQKKDNSDNSYIDKIDANSNSDSEGQSSEDNIPLEDIKELIGTNRKMQKKKRNKQYNKSKLFGLIKLTNMKKYTTSNNNINNNALDPKTTLNNNSNNLTQTPTEVNFPQLKPQNSNSIQLLKSVNMPQPQINCGLNLVEISSEPKRNSTAIKLQNQNSKMASIKTFDSSSSENIIVKEPTLIPIIKESTLVPIQPSMGINIKTSERTSPKPCKNPKVDMETQTQDIYFKMHWSYFLGTNQIISSKPSNEQSHMMNKSFNIFIENNSANDFYIQKFAFYHKKKLIDQKDKNTRNNTEKIEKNIKAGANPNQKFNSIAGETIKNNNIPADSNKNESMNNIKSKMENSEKDNKKRMMISTKK